MDSSSLISLIGIIITAIIGPVCILFFTNYFKKKDKEAAKKEEIEKQLIQASRDENFRQLHALIDGMVNPIAAKVDTIAKDLKKTDAKVDEVVADVAKQQEETIKMVRQVINELYAEQVGATCEAIDSIKVELSELKENTIQMKKANRASLRNALLNAWYQSQRRGYTTEYERENFLRMYNAYTAIGGNSFIQSDIKPKFDALPSKTEYDAMHNYINEDDTTYKKNK